LKNNVISLKDFKERKIIQHYEEFDSTDLEDPVVIGWTTDENGDRALHIVSAVDTKECLWMIDLAQQIVDKDTSECINENE